MISVNVKGIYLPKDEYDAGRGIDGRILENQMLNHISTCIKLTQHAGSPPKVRFLTIVLTK